MSNFMDAVIKWKTWACLMFTGTTIVYGVISVAFGREWVSVWMLLQFLVISAVGTLLQGIAFNEDWIIKKAKYTTRMFIFIVPFLAMLTLAAIVFNWFPKDDLVNWAVFLVIFLLIFVVMTVSFELVFKITGKRYDGLLGQYKEKREKQ